MRVLSLDVGRNKTGVAISESTLEIVTPLQPILFPLNGSIEKWFEELMLILRKNFYDPSEIEVLVLGSWKDRDHKNSEMKKLVKSVISFIERKTKWKVELVRETYTSVESREILKSMGVKEKRRYRSVDSYAASLLLIDYLELVRPNQKRLEDNAGVR